MTPIEKDKIVALCEKWGLKESLLIKDVYLAEDDTGITINLRGYVPLAGVTIAGTLVTEGHGNLKVEDYQREIEAIMNAKTKTRIERLSSPASGSRKPDPSMLTNLTGMRAVDAVTQSVFFKSLSIDKVQSAVPFGAQTKEAILPKLGTHDTLQEEKTEVKGGQEPPLPASKVHKAKCKECKVEFELTLDEAKVIYENYDGIYCKKCIDQASKIISQKGKHEETKVKSEKKEGDNKVMEAKIKVCTVCGLEIPGARALECFQKDKPFQCEECEDKQKIKGDEKIMEEKLPDVITEETKLTTAVIRQYICPTATDAEAYNFLQLCAHRKLNPFLNEAYLIKYGTQPATMVVGKDAFIRKAAESGQYDGFEAGIIIKTSDGKIDHRVGAIQYEGDVLVGGWAKVFRKDMKYPFVCEVPLTEYMKYKDGKPQSSWAIMPGTMIRKVAVVQGHREAFARELGGCYDASELLG